MSNNLITISKLFLQILNFLVIFTVTEVMRSSKWQMQATVARQCEGKPWIDEGSNRTWRSRWQVNGSNHFVNGAYHLKTPRSYHARQVSGLCVATKVVKMIVVSLSYCHVANA